MRWSRGISYSGYDRHGKLKYLSGRPDDPGVWSAHPRPVEPEQSEEALHLLCDAFDIPEDQKYCLRPEDDLMAIYGSIVGPRSWDDMEFERLWMNLDESLGRDLSKQEFESLSTVGDVVRLVAGRQP